MTPSRPITKELFAAGLQCAKRLYRDFNDPADTEETSSRRQALADIGVRLIDLARAAFPQSKTADPDDAEAARNETAAWLAELPHTAILDAAFAANGLEIRTDVVIPDGQGNVDLFEVKSGTKVKKRHVRDLAFQVNVIEACGYRVRQAWVLHLNTEYKHRGGANYPVHEIFKNVDVTPRVRSEVQRTADFIENFKKTVDDDTTLDLPTGTWCSNPFPCPYEASCREQGPEQPLIDLPDLGRDLESKLHEEGIEELTNLDPERAGLTMIQRRALRAMQSGEPVVEPFVGAELRDVTYPLHIVDVTALLQVLPVFEDTHPWEHLPFQWTNLIVQEDGSTESHAFVADGKSDMRAEFVTSLLAAVQGAGTILVYGSPFEQRLRSLLEDGIEKPSIRAILNQPRFDLKQLIRVGVFFEGFDAKLSLANVYQTIVGGKRKRSGIQSDDEAQAACSRLINSRTRATTRTKLIKELTAYGELCTGAVHELYRHLLEATVQDEAAST